MRAVTPDTTNPLTNLAKIYIAKSILYTEHPKAISNSLDTNKACHSTLKHK